MRIKLSHEKETYPGPKQVWRFSDEAGKYSHDLIALADETVPHGGLGEKGSADSCRPVLELVMERGSVIEGETSRKEARLAALNAARERAREELETLPAELLLLDSEASYSVGFSNQLIEERQNLERRQTNL
jgi:nicotinate phosphoribosyltransferase